MNLAKPLCHLSNQCTRCIFRHTSYVVTVLMALCYLPMHAHAQTNGGIPSNADVANISVPFCREQSTMWGWNGASCIGGNMQACPANADVQPNGIGWNKDLEENCYLATAAGANCDYSFAHERPLDNVVVQPTPVASCDYSLAHEHNGYGFDPVTGNGDNCPPLDNVVTQPNAGSNCDYSFAHESNGYGYDPATGNGDNCPPLDTVVTQPSVANNCDYSLAHEHNGYGFDPVTGNGDNCPPLDNVVAQPSVDNNCDYSLAHEHNGYGFDPATGNGDNCPPLDNGDSQGGTHGGTVHGAGPIRFASDPYGMFDQGQAWAGQDATTSQAQLNSRFSPNAGPNSDNYPVNRDRLYFDDRTADQVKENDPVSEGAFRIHCGISHFQQVDPIVSPGQASHHLHMFWGNTLTDQHSQVGNGGPTDISQNGQSTCQGGPYNRSAYWMPALLDENNNVVIPSDMHIYYKSKIDIPVPYDNNTIGTVHPLPLGVQLLGGNIDMPRDWTDQQSFTGGLTTVLNNFDADFVNWTCYSSGGGGPLDLLKYIPSSEVCRTQTAPGREPGCSPEDNYDGSCRRYTALEAQIRFPECLAVNANGSPVLESANNVDHAYVRYSYNQEGPNGELEEFCPASHPYRIPQITYRVRFHIPGSEDWGAQTSVGRGGFADTLAGYH